MQFNFNEPPRDDGLRDSLMGSESNLNVRRGCSPSARANYVYSVYVYIYLRTFARQSARARAHVVRR